MSFEIVTDSCCNLPEDSIEKLNLTVLPLTFMVDGVQYQSYLKGKKTDLKQFYTMMRDGKVITTSLPNLAEVSKTFESILNEGKDILYIAFSSGLSGTCNAISTLVDDLQNSYPDRTITVIDSLAASLGQGLLVYLVCQKAQEGTTLEELAQWTKDTLLHVCHWFTVDDLMFLHRGGRVSKTSAIAGSILNIKPVLHVDNEGHLILMSKAKGRKKSIQALVKQMEQTAIQPVKDQIIGISHGDCLDDAKYLKQLVEEKFGCSNFIINYIDPVIGAHSGPGTLALFFLGDHR